jgi:hypothetical protein
MHLAKYNKASLLEVTQTNKCDEAHDSNHGLFSCGTHLENRALTDSLAISI